MASGPISSWQINRGKVETVTDFTFLGFQITEDGDCSHEAKGCLLLGRKAMTNLDSVLKSRHYFADKGLSSQSCVFSSSHVWMWKLDHKEGWAPKKWTVVLEKTPESPLDCKEMQPVHPEGNHPWLFIGRTDAEGEAPILWPPDAKSRLIGKDPDAGRDWGQEDRGWVVWMASLTQWTRVWVNSGSWWWTGRPGVLQSMGSQEVGHIWATEQQHLLSKQFSSIKYSIINY